MTETPTDKNVMLALLSLDAYSRGENPQLKGRDGNALSDIIGKAMVDKLSRDVLGANASISGFSAASYKWAVDGAEQTVIAYRGTDFITNGGWPSIETIKDVVAGWSSSFGITGDDTGIPIVHLQPYYAEEFYKDVTGHEVFPGWRLGSSGSDEYDSSTPANVIITGHSLGGSLAGFIGSLTGTETVAFNEIPYLGLALTASLDAFFSTLTDADDAKQIAQRVLDALNGEGTTIQGFRLPFATNVTSYRMAGEIAGLARLLGPFLGIPANTLIDKLRGVDGAKTDLIALAALAYGQTVDLQSQIVPADAHGGGLLDAISLHSQALMVLTTYADSEHLVSWSSVGDSLFKAYFNDDVGVAANADLLGGYGLASSKMLDAIAYSVLDEGNLVFGNTGARALFDDADALGALVSSGKASRVLRGSLDGLAEAIVQFAGLMAVRQVNYHDYESPDSPFHPEQGILDLSDADGKLTLDPANAALLTLNVNQDLWALGRPSDQSGLLEILGIQDLIASMVERAEGTIGRDLIAEAMAKLYKNNNSTNPFSITDTIGSVQFSLSEAPLVLAMGDKNPGFDRYHASVFVATDGDDIIDGNGQNNIIAGSNGDDTLIGHLGSDILIGGNGSDLFIDSVTERYRSTGQQNENDIYIGRDQTVGLLSNFVDWLMNGTETDTVRYTIDPFTYDNSATPEDESALQAEGVTVTGLKTTKLGQTDAIEITVRNDKTGKEGTDLLVSIDKVELSDRPDHIEIDDDALNAPILIDMGKSGRLVSELQPGEKPGANDFVEKVDVADYSKVSHGLVYLNGVTSTHGDVGSLDDVFQWNGFDQELLTLTDYVAKGALGYNDTLHVTGADKIKLTDHDDVVMSADYGSIIETGAGNDKIWFMDGVAVSDLSKDDRIALAGVLTLYGGLRNEASENPYAWGPYGTSYGFNAQGDLIIRNAFWHVKTQNADGTSSDDVATMYVLNWKGSAQTVSNGGELGAGGIFIAQYHISAVTFRDITLDMKGQYSVMGEGLFEILGMQIKTLTGHDSVWGGEDPLVLDLDGDGIELTAIDYTKPRFDGDDDLYAEASGFVGKDDGILVRDLDGDGKITSSAEMFGKGLTSGFSILAALDGNHDGVIDSRDNGMADFDGDGDIDASDTFDRLLVWQDANENHTTDTGELKSVTARGITSISVTPTQLAQPQSANGNIITSTASFTMQDGTVRTIADVLLHLENQNTTYVGPAITVSSSVTDVADLKGRGTLVSLHQAMSYSPTTEVAVRAAITGMISPDLASLRTAIMPILTAWAEGSPIKINGVVTSGQSALSSYDDLTIVRKNGDVVDYAWGLSTANGQGAIAGIQMASGVVVATNGTINSRSDLTGLLDRWTSAGSSATVTTGQETLDDGSTVSYIDYRSGSDYLRIYHYGKAAWSRELTAANPSVATDVSLGTVKGSDFAFYERFLGESLQPFFQKPDSSTAGYAAVTSFLDKMDDVLNLFAVRLAVQSGPLSKYFASIRYSVETDSFASRSGNQIAAVFTAFLDDAEKTGDAAGWLTNWKQFFDVFLADYSRGDASQQNSYAFLVQNMMNAVDQNPGGVTVQQFAHAFGIPDALIVAGAGDVTGTNGDDIILVDGDETTVAGRNGVDNYIVGRNFKSATISDDDGPLGSAVDTLRFAAHKATDLSVSRDGKDLLLTDTVTGQTVRITNQFFGRWPGATIGNAWDDWGVDQIIFADGTVWTKVEIAEAVSKIDDASTHIVGTAAVDVLQGGKGDDLLEGGGDTDIYRIGRGDGRDIIHDWEDNAFRNDQDMLQFLDGIRINDLIFQRDGSSNDLVIKFKNDDVDQVTIQGQFSATYTGVYGTWYMERIDLFTFDNGTSLTSDQVAQLVLQTYSTDGNDSLYGFNREDILHAGKGDDFISGGNQSDLYLYSRGDGNDVIQDANTNYLSGSDDYLRFGVGIKWSDLSFGRIEGDYNSVVIYINGNQGSVTLKNEYGYAATGVLGNVFFDRIEEIQFADGSSSVDSYELAAHVLASQKTAGNDIIQGFDIDDILDGGAGDDFLYGNNGDDTYIWGRGYGNDTIQDRNGSILAGGDHDKIVFSGSVTTSDIRLSRDPNAIDDLIITLIDTGETLRLVNQYWYTTINYHPDQIDEIHFSDGTVWDTFQAMHAYLNGAKTAGDDVIYGIWADDTLDGGAGNDILRGGDGSDTYIFGYGYGNDTIEEEWRNVFYADDDAVQFLNNVKVSDVTFSRVGDYDLLLTLAGSSDTLLIKNQFLENVWDMTDVERFVFSDGTTITKTQVMQNLLTSTSGNDTLIGFVYNDTFTYRRGGGNDTIIDYAWNGNEDELLLADINQSEIKLVRDGNDLRVLIVESAPGAGDAGSVLLKNNVNDNNHEGIEKMTFADGTTWTIDQIRAALLAQTATDGNDTIIGMNVADTITGGRGDDFMNGAGGNDTYVYARGDGNDTIQEDYYSGYDDRLVFTNINVADISLTHNENDVTILVKESAPGAGDGGSIVLKGELNIDIWHTTGLESIVFADGTTWSNLDLLAKLLTPTGGDDNLIGFVTDDTIIGGRGNDFMNGVGGNDTYVYARGDGNDVIQEDYYSGGSDRLVFTDINTGDVTLTRNGLNVTIVINESAPGAGDGGSILLKSEMDIDIWHTTGVESIVFADGTTWSNVDLAAKLLTATAGNDTLVGFVTEDTITGGRGDDFMNGAGGNDTYVYARGDGNDTIQEDYYSGGNDRLVFSDINAGDVLLVRDGNNVKIVIKESAAGAGDGGVITLKSELDIDIWRTTGVEQIIFADGTAWQNTDLAAKILTQANPGNDDIVGFSGNDVISAGDGDDIVHAGSGNDTITGGLGDDNLYGEGGSDTYLYRKGDGNDLIVENATGSEKDRLVLSDLSRADTRFAIDEIGIILSFAPSGSVALRGTGVSEVQFADGSIMTYAEVAAEAIANGVTDGNDVIGSVAAPFRLSNVSVDLRKGNDTLYADGVAQITVNYGSGDGNDRYRLKASGGQSSSVLKLHRIAADDVSYAATISNDLIIRFASTGQSITVSGQLQSNEFGFASIMFDDGTTASRSAFQQVGSYIGTDTDDVLGTQANPFRVSNVSVNLGLGNDKFYADYVAGDIVQYSRGDGNDVYRFWNNAASTTSVRLAGIDVNDLDFSRNNNDLQIVDRSTGQVVTFTDQFAGDNFGINRIILDQSELSRADFSAQVWYRGTSGNDVFGTQSSPFTTANAKIDLGKGDDTFYGDWLTNAVLRYSHGDGNDTYRLWNGSASTSTLVFSDLLASDIDVLRSGDAMVLTDTSNGQSVTITGQFINNSYGFGSFRFSNGSTLSRDEVAALAWIRGTNGNDVLGTQSSPFSTANAKVDLGTGDDTFYGNGVSNVTIRYRHGDGNDVYRLWNGASSASTLVFSDLLSSDVALSRSGDALFLTDRSNGQTVSITDQFAESNFGFGYFRFADNTVWTSGDAAIALASQNASVGNDTINGTGAADTLAGGKGDDAMNGGGGDDTYVYHRGDGNDTITEDAWSGGYNDRLVFTDLNPADVKLVRNGNDLKVVIAESAPGADDAGSILIKNTLDSNAGQGIEQIVFANGMTWTIAQARAMVIDQAGTAGNDTIVGTNVADILTGRGGDDVLNGGGGDDTYVYARGDGNDTIIENAWGGGFNDRLLFTDSNPADVGLVRNGNDLTVVIAESAPGAGNAGSVLIKNTLDSVDSQGIEQIVFADGTTWTIAQVRAMVIDQAGTAGNDTIVGTNVADILTGRGGDDVLSGGGGDDSYVYVRGDGNDTIIENAWGGGFNDRLLFIDLNPADVKLVRNGNDLMVVIAESAPGAGNAGSVLIKNTLDSVDSQGVEQIVFADGTIWQNTDFATILNSTPQILTGTTGDDHLIGTNRDDTFDSLGGNDYVNGGEGSDTYLYSINDGDEYIDDESGSMTDVDVLKLKDINYGDVTFSHDSASSNLVMTINSTGHIITFDEQYYAVSEGWGLEKVEFANGISVDLKHSDEVWAYHGSVGDDHIVGAIWGKQDVFEGGKGNDYLNGEAGGDTYIYSKGDGSDYIDDEAGFTDAVNVDVLRLTDLSYNDVRFSRDGSNMIVTVTETGDTITLDEQYYSSIEGWGLERIEFANGMSMDLQHTEDVWSYKGSDGDDHIVGAVWGKEDIFEGGKGNDYLSGEAGSDTYVYSMGDGSDLIYDNAGFTVEQGNTDILRFTDLNLADLTFVRDGNDLKISVNGTSDAITVDRQFQSTEQGWGVEKIEFADASSWNLQDIWQNVPATQSQQTALSAPVLLDLNNDGHIDLRPLDADALAANSSVAFDWNGDGARDNTVWVGPQDGFLAIDLGGNGQAGADGVIDQSKELAFSEWATPEQVAANGGSVSDLDGLRLVFDSNHDNVLDANDDRWSEFRVWRDANQNGSVDDGELQTMSQAGIKLINLLHTPDGSQSFPDGSAITGTSSYQTTDSTSHYLVGDATLSYQPAIPKQNAA